MHCRSIPILLYAVLDRPVKYFTTLMRYPQVGDTHPRSMPCITAQHAFAKIPQSHDLKILLPEAPRGIETADAMFPALQRVMRGGTWPDGTLKSRG